jgi:hypothetical protein
LSRVRRVLAAGSVSALILGAMAVPAFAFVHENVPADECSDNTTAGANGTAGENVATKNPAQTLPLGQPDRAPVPATCQ